MPSQNKITVKKEEQKITRVSIKPRVKMAIKTRLKVEILIEA